MKIQYASDLHLEFTENRHYLVQHPLQPAGDILLLAGDICKVNALATYDWFFDQIAKQFKVTYWIPGNHEYYGYDLQLRSVNFCEPIRNNVFLVNDHAETIEGTHFIFSTMWTKILPSYRRDVERGMNDFRLIRFGDETLNAEHYNELHKTSLAFLEKELQALGPKVVVTHHAPTLQHYPPEYLGSVLNQGFAVNLDRLIESTNPNVWIDGHHHRNIPAFTIGKTQMLTNQLGYVAAGEHHLFNPAAFFDLS
ncbi:MAG TPA: metallophosphoesterase [Mucilaginibacter sp.]